jgi:hypothetical protein
VWPNARAVAAIIRSAGSRGGAPGRAQDEIETSADKGASRIPGSSSRDSNHAGGAAELAPAFGNELRDFPGGDRRHEHAGMRQLGKANRLTRGS